MSRSGPCQADAARAALPASARPWIFLQAFLCLTRRSNSALFSQSTKQKAIMNIFLICCVCSSLCLLPGSNKKSCLSPRTKKSVPDYGVSALPYFIYPFAKDAARLI